MYRRLHVSYSMFILFVATVENHKSVCRPYDTGYLVQVAPTDCRLERESLNNYGWYRTVTLERP